MDQKGETREESDSKGVSHSRAGPKLGPFDNKSNWGESSLESLDSLGSLDSHTKLSPLSSKPSRISEIIRTSSLSPVQEGPGHIIPNMSTPIPSKPNLGELKPPIRHHHKNLLSGSGTSPNEKFPSHLNLGPIVSHNHPNANTANLSPNATNHKSPVSPRSSPGQGISPRLNKSSPNKEESSISPNQSFAFGSPAPLGHKPKFDVPPLGEIAHVGRLNHSNHPNPAGPAELAGAVAASTTELGPLSSGRGVPSPRLPLGASPLQPLGAIRVATSAPAPAALESVHEESKSSSPVEDNPPSDLSEEKGRDSEDHAGEFDSKQADRIQTVVEIEAVPANVRVLSAVESNVGAESIATEAAEEPVHTAVLHEVSVVTVEAPVVHIVESSVEESPLITINVESLSTEKSPAPEESALREEISDNKSAEENPAAPVTLFPGKVHVMEAPERVLIAAVQEIAEPTPIVVTTIEPAIQEPEPERVLRMETPPQSPRQAPRQLQATPHAATHSTLDIHEIQNPTSNTEETAATAASAALDATSVPEVEPAGGSFQIPPPNTPVRGAGGSKMSRFSRTPASGGRSLLVAPLALGEATSSALNSGKSQASDSPPPSTPSSHSHSPVVPGTPTLSPRSHGPSHASTPHTPSHAHFFKGRSTSNLSIAGSTISSLERLHLHAHPPIQPLAAHKYEMSYNKAASDLRTALLHLDADESNSKLMVRNIFRKLDVNEHGELTAQELKNFVLSPELGLFEVDDPRALKYATLLMEQIDINGDGSVSLSELETFLWPPHMNAEKSAGPGIYSAASADFKEIGMILDFTRTAVRYHVSSVAALGSAEAILLEFAKLAKATLKRGCLDTKQVKRAFLNLKIPEFGRHLTQPEVDQLYVTLDCNDDGVVSAREFKEWLFPAHKQEDLNSLSTYLKKLIAEHFQGDVWHMYRFFCNGSEQLYKNDFGVVLKTLDGSISKHEAQAMAQRIAGNDKCITMAMLLSVLGLVGRTTLTAADGSSVYHSGSADADSTINTGSVASGRSKRHRRTSIGSGRKLATHEEEAGFNESMDLVEREDDQEQQANDNESVGSLSDASELSFDSTGMDATDGMGVSDAAVRADSGGLARAAVIDKNAPSEIEKAVIRDLLFKTTTSSGSRSPPSKPSQLNSSTGFHRSPHQTQDFAEVTEESELKGVRKTVGLVPNQLVALGYAEHMGRWRGFPYDNWSCCETNQLECPVISPRQSFGSPGSSPNKNRLSVESVGSLHQRTKSPPFRPAGTSPTKAPPVVVELRETAPLPEPAPRRRSPQRSPARATIKTTATSRAFPARKPAGVASAPSRATPVTSSNHAVRRSAASSTAAPSAPAVRKSITANPVRSASPAKMPNADNTSFGGDKFKEAKKNRVPASSKPVAAAPAPAGHVKSAESKLRITPTVAKKSASTSSALKKRTTSPAPAQRVPAKQQQPKQQQPKQQQPSAAPVLADVAPVLEQVAPAAPSDVTSAATKEEVIALGEPPAIAAEEAASESSKAAAVVEHAETPEVPEIYEVEQEYLPVPLEAKSSPAVQPPVPPSALKTDPPRISGSYQSPLQRPSVQAPPITPKFTVRVPAPAPPNIAPEVSDLFNRLRQPDVAVEAQQVRLQLQPPAPKWSAEVTNARKPTAVVENKNEPGKRCSSPVAHDIADLVETASLSGSQAFEATLQSLHSELDAVRRQSMDQELSFTALIDENRRKLSTLQQSFESTHVFNDDDVSVDHASSDSDGEDIEFRDPCAKLRVTGSRFGSRRGISRASLAAEYAEANKSALSITLGPLDSPFLPNEAHSPNKYSRRSVHSRSEDKSQRSHSAPARRYHNTSNNDSFFSGSFSQLLTSPATTSSIAKSALRPCARSSSPHRASAASVASTVNTLGLPVSGSVHTTTTYKAAHDKGIWVPSSPLHGESFNRIRKQKWRKKDAVSLAKTLEAAERRSQSRSPSPARAVRDRPRERSPSPAPHTARVVVNGVEKPSPRPALRVTAAPICRTEPVVARTRRAPSPAAQKKNLPSSRQKRASSPQYSSESKQTLGRRDSGRISPAYGVLPDHANPDRAQYNLLFEPMQTAFPPVPPSPSPSMLPYQSLSVGAYPAYAPASFGMSPVPLHPLQLSAPPAYFPSSPGYAVPLPQQMAGYSNGAFYAPQQQILPGSPGMPMYSPQPVYQYMVPAVALPGFMPGGANNDAWWSAIQAQKLQNEKMAFESELSARHVAAVPNLDFPLAAPTQY